MIFNSDHYEKMRKLYRLSRLPLLYKLPTLDFHLISGEDANNLILNVLEKNEPAMIARFGYGELRAVVMYAHILHKRFHALPYIFGEGYEGWWAESVKNGMPIYNGFFPTTIENLNRFGAMMMEDMQALDILASWVKREKYFEIELKHCKKIPLIDLDPYFHEKPWTRFLKGKKVLVVHPFEKSIQQQYARREKLFQNPDILPEFHLKTIPAVQTVAGNRAGYESWFDALEWMKHQIRQTDFDVAILGCGAYGFPLAAFVKSLGKKAIHLGGATQVLFGIKGSRWAERPEYAAMFNDYWVSPLEEEKPKNAEKVEGGCYW